MQSMADRTTIRNREPSVNKADVQQRPCPLLLPSTSTLTPSQRWRAPSLSTLPSTPSPVMPARTLSSDSELLSPLRYAPYVQSPPLDLPEPPGHAMQNVHPAHAHISYRPYPPAPAHASLQHFHHRGATPHTQQDYVYPMAPPMQRTEDLAWRVHPVVPSQWSPHSSIASGWLPHPPQRVAPMMLPPPLLHKVWILDCQTCGTFLTNRGMKAVLLLRPSVPLYSTDALPINCSPYAVTAETTAAAASSSNSHDQAHLPAVARTCECLTQTLWCQGCGTAVGYMIVTPCLRCTSSITPNNRSTNGHRFVFYSAEIIASERHYVPGECGINVDAQSPDAAPHHPTPATSPPRRSRHASGSPRSQRHVRSSAPVPPPRRRDSSASNSFVEPPSPRSDRSSSPPPLIPLTPPRATHHSRPGRLREGEVVFWHHLARSGEVPAVSDDPRARAATEDEAAAGSDSASKTKAEASQSTAVRAKMIAGR
ncbi:uncharacterized protein PHACADRAFT_209933 [Phanerochaete carnosa HHB-10118-sp]|uniref:Protein FAM72 n=1 Tax=Phanerochaete carnosa (strain HHB-10118-sp) TaxID=650164 RepID=K5WUH6_PHACS|nr:uncharacterized protein PHACADRAFT_209933 [Phanerochaete carnosa HHB-10118-sp]EKM54112.1 hypothetical protein PHACADRAFT_209933 [Phanerochaete carnosa HHB-10118-sp]